MPKSTAELSRPRSFGTFLTRNVISGDTEGSQALTQPLIQQSTQVDAQVEDDVQPLILPASSIDFVNRVVPALSLNHSPQLLPIEEPG